VGAVYFGQLDTGNGPVHSATAGMLVVVGLYVLAACAALALPPGRVQAAGQQAPVTAAGTAGSARTAGACARRTSAADAIGTTGAAGPAELKQPAIPQSRASRTRQVGSHSVPPSLSVTLTTT
jgi:hypothetical protein